MDKILKIKFLHNTVENWLWFLGILIIGWIFKRFFSIIVSRIVYRMIKKETENVSVVEFVNLLKQPFEFIITLIIFYTAFDEISFARSWRIIPLGKIRVSDFVDKLLDTLFIIAITWVIIRLIKFFALVFIKKSEQKEDKRDLQLTPFFRDIIITIVVFFSFFFILGFVFNKDIVSLITGLGIGGVALALAARATLENLFASFTLITEKSFVVGDEIQINDIGGKVEKIGFRSTHVRHYDGSLLIIPNQTLVSDVLNNITQRKERRHKFFIRLKLDTPLLKVKEVIKEINQLLLEEEKLNIKDGQIKLDTVGDYSINILVVFFAKTPDYWESKSIREHINYEISTIFEKYQIELAPPMSAFIHSTNEKTIDDDI
jgi:MscS family membrane protein